MEARAGADPPGRERLELEDFDIPAGEEFDPLNWLNARLAKSAVTLDRLDQHLSSLGMSCQLLCQDTSESIEVAANQLVAQFPSTGRDLERMHQETLRGRTRLGTVLEGLKDADDRKRSGLQGLADIDAVKNRVELAGSALREVNAWERKVQSCDQLIHSNNLPGAMTQITALKGVLDAFRMLPEYAKKEEQLQELEENLLGVARRRARQAIERNAVADLKSCGEVFAGMQRAEEPANIATAVLVEMSEKTWQSQDPSKDNSPLALASTTKAVLDGLAQSLEERWSLLQSLEAVPAAAEDGVATDQVSRAASTRVLVVAVRAALKALSVRIEAAMVSSAAHVSAGVAPGEDAGVTGDSSAHVRASRAVALLAAYVDGFAKIAECPPVAKSLGLWREICQDQPGHISDVLPWALLREVTQNVIYRSMQDDALALVPQVSRQIRPSEAVLAAESNAKRLLNMCGEWQRRVEQQGAGGLAVLWLACVDESCASYWRQWDKLIETFQNTLALKNPREGDTRPTDCVCDTSLLNECMQLHGMLHDSLPAQFSGFQAETLQIAARMRADALDSAFGLATSEKLRDADAWCERLAVPSAIALRSAHGALEGVGPDSAALMARASRALPAASAALAAAEKEVHNLVARCCVQPVSGALAGYSDAPEWAVNDDPSEGEQLFSLEPLQCITAVGEHLFSLAPLLERSHDSAQQLQWLPTILDGVVDIAVQKVLQIKLLNPRGARQLTVDLEYLQKVTDALGAETTSAEGLSAPVAGAGAAAARLGEILDALTSLAARQLRKRECIAKGIDFKEEPREGAPLNWRSEQALRSALDLT